MSIEVDTSYAPHCNARPREAHQITNGQRPIVSGFPGTPAEVFLFDTIGNADLPPSTIRGLTVMNSQSMNSANIRIDITDGEKGRVAPEIRDCILTGESEFGLQMICNPGITLEAVVERNLVTRFDPFMGMAGIDIVHVGGTSSPLVRANQVQLFPTNVQVAGGGLDNQPRIQSNFIQVGNTNVGLEDCAPFIVNNTIAFAENVLGAPAFGISWTAMPELSLSNNLIWNPANPGETRTDVAGSLAPLGANPARIAFGNIDEDDTLFVATLALVPGVATFHSVAQLGGPNFAGGDLPGGGPRDLHLTATSWAVGEGWLHDVATLAPHGVLSATLPSGLVVRVDVAYDIDFEGRVQGVATFLGPVDVGADEFTGFDPVSALSPTRGATLQFRTGSATNNDADIIGNLRLDATGQWTTEVEVVGQPGDVVIFMAGFGFSDTTLDRFGNVVENRAVYQNHALSSVLVPGLQTIASLGVELGADTVTWPTLQIPTNGVLQVSLLLGSLDPGFVEGEVQLQALVADPTLQMMQSTARLTLEVNE